MGNNSLLDFKAKLKTIFPEKYSLIEPALEKDPVVSFRINTLMHTEDEVLESITRQGIKYRKGPFPFSYCLTEFTQLNDFLRDLVSQSKIYVQNFSSMIAVAFMNLEDYTDSKVLDLCAAPGGKTTYIAQFLKPLEGNLFAAENNTSRFFSLKRVLMGYGAGSTVTLRSNSVNFSQRYPQFLSYFDRVLVDAPCSNEGNIRGSNLSALSMWSPKHAKKLPFLQKKILYSGVSCLRPGGRIVYSTCTYSPEENEEVAEWILQKFPKLKLINPDAFISHISSRIDFTYTKGLRGENTKDTLHILPNDYFNGFFVAAFELMS